MSFEQIVKNLQILKDCNRTKKQHFKVKAYNDAIIKLNVLESNTKICIDDIDKLSLGRKITDKVNYIINTGKDLDELNDIDTNINIMNELQKIHNIGPSKAKLLVSEHKILSIAHLRENIHLLNSKEQSGLKYHDDIIHRIPREEMIRHIQLIKTIISQIDFEVVVEITGSYRRGESSCGDIDVLICSKETTNKDILKLIISEMIKIHYVPSDGVFASGGKKFMGMVKLPKSRLFRRLDILITSKQEFPFSLLYFTGNGTFNVKMRDYAKRKGLLLNEKGLYAIDPNNRKNVTPCDLSIKSEEDIFDYLKIKYINRSERVSNITILE